MHAYTLTYSPMKCALLCVNIAGMLLLSFGAKLWMRVCSEIGVGISLLEENWKYLVVGIVCQACSSSHLLPFLLFVRLLLDFKAIVTNISPQHHDHSSQVKEKLDIT